MIPDNILQAPESDIWGSQAAQPGIAADRFAREILAF